MKVFQRQGILKKHCEKEINIIIATEFISDWYIGYYYESGPYGYQDSRYWDEEHVDDFKTWTHDVIDCREDEQIENMALKSLNRNIQAFFVDQYIVW